MAGVEEDDRGRLEIAEEAVRIVRRFNMAKDKGERQKKIIELCTDIAGILDAKRRLEELVETQKAELTELRKQTSSANTSSTSGRGSSVTPEDARESTSTPQVSYTPSSSERGTGLCDRGTDPLYEWPRPERTSTCTRSTSPLLFPGLSNMTSPVASRENLANQEQEEKNSETTQVDVETPARQNEDECYSDQENTDGDEHQPRRDKESDEESDEHKDDQKQLAAQENDKENDKENEERASQRKSASPKSTPQTSTRSRQPEVASPKKQDRKKIPAARDQSPKKNGSEKLDYKPSREKTYKTLWKTNQLNLFDDSRSAKERKNNAKNRAKDKSSAGSKSKAAQLRGCSNKNTADKHQSESSSSSCDSEEDEELTRKVQPELTAEYWDIHKLIKFLKLGNPTATVIALCALRDVSIEQESSQLAILELGGINILLNILKTDHWACVVGSLKILRVITNTKRISTEIVRLGGIQQLSDCLQHDLKEVQSLAAETLSHVVTFRLAYSAMRRGGGIKHLVNIIQPEHKKRGKPPPKDDSDFQLTHNACMALWSCCRSPKNIQAIRAAGAVPILASLLVRGTDVVILPAMGIIQECATEAAFREDIRREGMVEGIVKHLKRGDIALKTLCANALFKCAEDDSTRELIFRFGGLELLVQMMTSSSSENNELLAATVGALWKLEQFGAVKALILLLKNPEQSHEVLANVLGAIHEFAHSKRAVLTLKDDKVIPVVVRALSITERAVLINATRLLSVCAKEQSCRSTILRSDGLRLLWSLLKFPNSKVVAGAADAISECVADEEESADMVRSFVGGLELITNLLRSDDQQVLISVNRAIINIGKDRENLSILTDYEVVPLLIQLVHTEDAELKRWVAEAIATCSGLDKNVKSFSSAVVPLADSLKRSSDVAVKRAIACALERLSRDPYNCYLIHQHDALKTLLTLTGSDDERVQEAAAGCIKNMRINTMNMLSR
ncbi:Armadillo repeat-containing protein 4 [Desmophyllum pertusum]|uniref:Armadillo repeat-containing protein 4 n=1 Tax=Desmophyllum pertusum TaxID=174260 RepID=A0A9W9ZI36_9CNID|nr:Armadillo repeat-containing protein 4 [Desmophyllum pertusum]